MYLCGCMCLTATLIVPTLTYLLFKYVCMYVCMSIWLFVFVFVDTKACQCDTNHLLSAIYYINMSIRVQL